jgi:hypothetical protein
MNLQMKAKRILVNFLLFFSLTFAVSAIVNFLWNLVFHGMTSVSWEISFRFAIILGILFTWTQEKGSKKKKEEVKND